MQMIAGRAIMEDWQSPRHGPGKSMTWYDADHGKWRHVFVGLKRTWDMKLALVQTQGINVLNLAISGLMLLTFMTIHLFQFRFGDTDQFGPYYIRPPPYLINFWGISSLNLFWTSDASVEKVGVRDIYARALAIWFRKASNGTVTL